MADYVLSAKLTADANGFSKVFQQANQQLTNLSKGVQNAGREIADFGKNMTITGAGMTAGFTAPFLKAIKTTSDFQASMTRAGVIAGASSSELDKMTESALELGATTSLSSTEVADAMTEMAAKGFDATQTIAAMPGVISAAEASSEDLALTADTVASALNGFGLEASESGRVADILAMAANASAAGVGDMGQAFKYAAPIANSLGISIEELSASVGILTDAGLEGGQAGTTLRTALTRLTKPTNEAETAMENLGFSAVDSNGNFKDLTTIVGELNSSMDGMTEAQKMATLSTIFGTEAASGMNLLLAASQEELAGLTTELKNAEGASAEAAAAMKDNLAGDIENFTGAIESATISLVTKLDPLFREIVQFATGVVESFANLDDGTQTLIAFGALGIAALGPLLTILGVMTMGIGGLVTAIGFLISPVGLVISAIVALGAVFGRQMATNEAFRTNVFSVFEAIRSKVTEVINTIVPIVSNLWSQVQPVLESFGSSISTIFQNIAPQIIPTLQNLGSQIATVFETVWGIIQAVAPIFTTLFSSIINGFNSVGGATSGFGINLSTVLIGVSPLIKGIILLFQNFGPQIVSAFQQIASMVIPVVATIGTALGQLAAAVIPMLTQAMASLVPTVMLIGQTFMAIITAVLPVVISLFNQLVPIIMQLVMAFMNVVAQVMPLVATLVSALLPVIQSIIQAVMNVVTAVAPAVIAIIQMIVAAINAMLPIIMSIITIVVQVVSAVIATISPIVAFIGTVISAIMSVITPIIVFVAGVISSVIAVITPIIAVVTGIFNTVFTVVSGIWQNIMTFIGSAINAIGQIISSLTGVVGSVFNSIFSTVTSTMQNVSSAITNVFSAIQNAWTGLQSFVSGVFSGIGSAVQQLVNQVKGFVNDVIGGVNAAVGLINKIPGVSIGTIPYLQHGTDNWSGGFAMMNEGGRGELVNLPNGAQVIPHDVSMRYAREAGRMNADNTGGKYVFNGTDTSRIESLLTKIAESGSQIILDTGEFVGATYPQYDRVGGSHASLVERWGG